MVGENLNPRNGENGFESINRYFNLSELVSK